MATAIPTTRPQPTDAERARTAALSAAYRACPHLLWGTNSELAPKGESFLGATWQRDGRGHRMVVRLADADLTPELFHALEAYAASQDETTPAPTSARVGLALGRVA